MKNKIVIVDIIDEFDNKTQKTFYLVNPDKEKLEELKKMIEHYSDERLEKKEDILNNIGDKIQEFVDENFEEVILDKFFEINY